MSSTIEVPAVGGAGEPDAVPPMDYDDFESMPAGVGEDATKKDPRFAHDLFAGYPFLRDFDPSTIVLNKEPMAKSADSQAATVFTFTGRQTVSPLTKKPVNARTFILSNVFLPFAFRPKSVPGAEKDDISHVKGLYQDEDGNWCIPGSTFGPNSVFEGVISLDEANRDDLRVLQAIDARLQQLAWMQRKAMFAKHEHLKKPDDMRIVLNSLCETNPGYSNTNVRVRMRGWSDAIESATTKIVTAKRDGSRAAVVKDVTFKYPRQGYVEPPPLPSDATEIVMNVVDPLTGVCTGITTLTPARKDNKIISVAPLEKLPNGQLAFRRVNPADVEGVYADLLLQFTAICSNGLMGWTCMNVLVVAFNPKGPKENPHHATFSSITTAPQSAVMAMIGAETHRLRESMGIAAPPRPLLQAPARAKLIMDHPNAFAAAVRVATEARERFSAASTPIVVSDNDEDAHDAAASACADAFFASVPVPAAAAAAAPSGGSSSSGAGSKRRAQDAMGGVEARVSMIIGGETGFGSPAALLGNGEPRDYPAAPAREEPIKRSRRADVEADPVRRVLDYTEVASDNVTGTGEGAGDEQE